MKRFIEGEERHLLADGSTVVRVGDRWWVRTPAGTRSAVAVRQGESVLISYGGHAFRVDRMARRTAGAVVGSGDLRAPMPGQIVEVLVQEGEAVEEGRRLFVLEAMKTQQPFVAPYRGFVASLPIRKGDQVREGDLLALIEPVSTPES